MSGDLDGKEPGGLEGLFQGALVPLSKNLPSDPDRLVQEIQMLNQFDTAINGIIHFERGRRLNELWPSLQGPEYSTFTEFIAKKFPEMHREDAYAEMRFAREAKNLPNFRGLANMRGGWRKIKLMMQEGSPEDLDVFDQTGEFQGISVDDKDSEELKRELKKAKKENQELTEETQELKDKVSDLETQLQTAGSPIDRAVAQIKAADKKVLEGLGMLAKVPREVMVDSKIVRDLLFGLVGLAYRVLENLETEASTAIAAAEARRQADED